MKKNFLIFGVMGWCAEILYTGICSLLAGDETLVAKTYLWMFPIYGLAGLVSPLFLLLRRFCPCWQRMGVYILAIFTVEYCSGWLLRLLTGACPWDYGGGFLSVGGLIRLDYAPLWAGLGLFFETISVFLAQGEVER
ncbi:MAG: hypothetical protein Q4C06_02390 [Bacillota bacterium]|nr:hypothetical protein [Bacillota bacterium]